jgi:hypothetical protein
LQRITRHIRVLARLQSGIIEARLRLLVRRSILLLLAGLIALFGLSMLNVAAFFALRSLWGPVWAAAAVAGGDFVIAIAVAGIALTAKSNAELKAALELRQAATEAIEAEFSGLRDQIALPLILIPLVTGIIRGLRKNKPGEQ